MIEAEVRQARQEEAARGHLVIGHGRTGAGRRMQDRQSGRLRLGELAGVQGVLADQLTLGDHQADQTRLRLVGEILPHSEDRTSRQQRGNRRHPHGQDEELRPLHRVLGPAADQHEPVQRTVCLQRSYLDR